ncbi:unnamed protein product [Trichobilharzia regenti]|nr:unnamed protein product [Trichobilharzia regenti]
MAFVADFILLCHGTLPKWVNRLARIVSGLPFIESFLPPHWVRPSLMYDCDYDEEDFREEEEVEDDEVVKTFSEDEKEQKEKEEDEEPKVNTEKNNRNLVIINETPTTTTTTTTTATESTDKLKNITSTSNSTTHYKEADDQNVQCSNDSLMKTFTEKPHFQFVYSASTGNGHVPHHNNNSNNNNKHSIDHSDNHHNASLCNIRMV